VEHRGVFRRRPSAARAFGPIARAGRALAGALALCAATAVVSPAGPRPLAARVEAQRRPPRNPREVQARTLFEQGQAAYEEGRYEDAIHAFEQAYALSARPLLLYNIANAQERLGLLREALENLRYYLEDAPADEQPVLERRIRGLEDRIRRQQAEEARRREEQQRVAEAAARAAVAQVGAGRTSEPVGSGPRPPVLGYTLLGLGGAAVATGVVFGVLALGARSDADADCARAGNLRLCTTEARDALARDATFSIFADVSVLAGIALAAVGAYLVVTHDHDTRGATGDAHASAAGDAGRRPARAMGAPRAEVGVGVTSGGASVVVRSRF
jgi:tetratricopeptide (TPR) repeat protein